MKVNWRVALLAMAAIMCVYAAFSHAMDTAPKLTLRITMAIVALSVIVLAVYTVCRTRRFRLSTLMLVAPIFAALLTTFATPYVRHKLLVDQLKQAGIDDYRLEPTELEAALGYLADEVLGAGFYSFSTSLTYATIDLDTCRTEKLRTISGGTSLTHVVVGNRYNPTSKFTPDLIAWLNSLPVKTTVSILGYQLDDDDVRSLSGIKRVANYRIGDLQSPLAIDFIYAVDADQLVIGKLTLPEGYKRPDTVRRAKSLCIDQDAKIDPALVIDLIESKQIEDLMGGKCNFGIEECSRLAALPGLAQVSIEGLGFDELMALSASKSLTTAHFLDPKLNDSELEQVRSAYASVIGSLFFTKPKRRILPLQ